MKHIFHLGLWSALLLSPLALSAQDTYLNERLTTVSDLNGTARFVGMGGALGALGADISVMSANPAGIGLYRGSDVTGTLSVLLQADKPLAGEQYAHLSLDNLGFVISHHWDGPVLKFLNFGFNYQKKVNFNHLLVADHANTMGLSQTDQLAHLSNLYAYAEGDDWFFPSDLASTADSSYLLAANNGKFYGQPAQGNQFSRITEGGVNAFDLNLSANLSEQFYLGATIGFEDIDYRSYTAYTELYQLEQDYYDYNMNSNQSVSATGVNAKFGIIVRPFMYSAFRFGITVETPTFYTMQSAAYMNMETHYDSDGIYHPEGLYRYDGPAENYLDYSLTTPWKFRFSLGHTMGDYLAVGAEYEYVNYAKTRMGYLDYNTWGGAANDQEMNALTRRTLKAGHNVKVGLEMKLHPTLRARLGYNYYSEAYNQYASFDQSINSYALSYNVATDYMNKGAVNLFTVGLGYQKKKFYVDLAYKYRIQNADFYAFDDSFMVDLVNDPLYTGDPNARLTPVGVNLNRHQIALSIGYKF